jgi:small subunit ribosomal protein S15
LPRVFDSIKEHQEGESSLLSKEQKNEIVDDHKHHAKDSGSPEVQIALITARINYLTKHFESNPQDHHSKRGLMKLVGQRKRLLEYLKRQDQKRYEKLIKKLSLRK